MSVQPPTREQTQIIRKATVLVVEDAAIMRTLQVSYLRDMGFTRTPNFSNGRAALDYIKHNRVDMIICDWDMPDMNGIELLETLRQDAGFRHIPFLMVTAVSDVNQVKQAISSGVTDYLTKPFQLEEYGYRIMKMLRKLSPQP